MKSYVITAIYEKLFPEQFSNNIVSYW